MTVALVTGGSRGIGAASAVALARAGYDVCINFRRDESAARAVAEQVQALEQRAVIVQGDVARPDDVARMFDACDRDLGTLTLLVNNAGVVAEKARVDEVDLARLRRLVDINVVGAFLCCREAVRRMSTRHGGEGGSIVNISSVASRLGGPGEYVDYAMTKGAIDTLTIGLAREVATEGVRVNAIRPGIIDTEIHASGGQPDRAERLSPLIPMQRPGSAQEVADCVVWLASEGAGYTTGSCIDISGGR